MSEFVDFSENEVRPLREVVSDLYDHTRDFIGSIVTQIGIVYQEEAPNRSSQPRPETPPTPPPHVCGASCSRCGIGGPQWRPRG